MLEDAAAADADGARRAITLPGLASHPADAERRAFFEQAARSPDTP